MDHRQLLREEAQQNLDSVSQYIDSLVTELRHLRDRLERIPIPVTENELAALLRSALANETGWRDKARIALGDYHNISCRHCGAIFPSGGKRRFHCGNCNL